MIFNEFQKMLDISRRVLRKITTQLPQQPLLSPRTEQLISMPTEKPLPEEELLPKLSQREFLPLKGFSEKIEEGQQQVPLIAVHSAPLEEEKPILLEPEEIQQGQLIPQTGSGIPVGGGTQRRRRMSDISRKKVLNRLIKRGAKSISKISRLVKKIGRKPKLKRKIGRRKVKKQIRRRTTIRRRPTTRRRTTTKRRTIIRRQTRR